MDRIWRPKNDNNTFLGPIRMREALYKSRNLVSIRLLQTMGIDHTIDYISRFGFNPQDLPRNLSLALGTATLTPMEIATGWTTFANGGYKIEPYLIERIEDREGKLLFEANPARVPSRNTQIEETEAEAYAAPDTRDLNDGEALDAEPRLAKQVLDERTAYIMTSMLQDVIKRGTGRRALAMGRGDIAGKTGTTNDSIDSWFSGYNADIVTTVWAGFDQPQSLGRNEYGGTVALPIWMSYMSAVLKDMPEHPPAEPDGLLKLRIDPVSGRSATPSTPDAYFEVFKSEDSPPPMGEFDSGIQAPGSPLPADEAAPLDLF
jgi:penicillin-binding protein 1A